MPGSVIVSGARTPIGRLSAALASLSAADLGALAIKAAVERAGISPDDVDYVYLGQVILAGAGQLPARQAAVKAGLPMRVPAFTVNKVCLSGLNAIYLADQMIQAGDAEVVVAGGQESMTNAPHLLTAARAGYRLGDATLHDSMFHDALLDPFDHVTMGLSTEQHMGDRPISREAQDRFAAQSHERAAAAIKDGLFAEEIVPVSIAQRKGDPIVVETDEGVRPGTTIESLGRMAPAFSPDGPITAGNSSQISDGGAAVIVMSKTAAERRGLRPLAEIVGYGQVAGPDNGLLLQPSNAIRRVLDKTGRQVADVDLFEINEAFAAVALASVEDLGIDEDVVNVNGGAIALGHPIGATGTRLALTLAHELRRRGGGLGVAAACGGGGQGDALLLKVGS